VKIDHQPSDPLGIVTIIGDLVKTEAMIQEALSLKGCPLGVTSTPTPAAPGALPAATPLPGLPGSALPGAPREIHIPADLVGGLIGPGGSTINDIRQKAGGQCHISVLSKDQQQTQGGPQVCRITGPEELLASAEALIQRKIQELLNARRPPGFGPPFRPMFNPAFGGCGGCGGCPGGFVGAQRPLGQPPNEYQGSNVLALAEGQLMGGTGAPPVTAGTGPASGSCGGCGCGSTQPGMPGACGIPGGQMLPRGPLPPGGQQQMMGGMQNFARPPMQTGPGQFTGPGGAPFGGCGCGPGRPPPPGPLGPAQFGFNPAGQSAKCGGMPGPPQLGGCLPPPGPPGFPGQPGGCGGGCGGFGF